MECADQDCRHCTHSDAVAVAYAREVAVELIIAVGTLDLTDAHAAAAWIGSATAVLKELTRV